jgi:hypothetical protein
MNTLVQNEAQRERFSGGKGIGMAGCMPRRSTHLAARIAGGGRVSIVQSNFRTWQLRSPLSRAHSARAII